MVAMKTSEWTMPLKGLAITVLCILSLPSCGREPAIADGRSFSLLNQENQEVRFPDDFRGKTLVLSFIYTNCPTVCVITTHSMELLKAELGDRDDLLFVSISLDPRRDRPEVLNDFARLRGIESDQWQLLTGSIGTIDSLCDAMQVYARKSFIEENEDGTEYYTIDHSDVVAIVNADGVVQKRYKGTGLDVEEVAGAINELL
ncbi:MAG: SCO family protein [Ignavibacteriae bacterium]|nr:SCO family protein [Ignavibacteriota bacterium]MCB9216198.1 SCO family protein [Ignavibacteria bacterium]